jgi:hypothetical protein
MEAVERGRFILGFVAGLGVCGLGVLCAPAARTWGLEDGGDPIAFRPGAGRKGQAVEVPRGEVLLFEVIQRLADYTGEPAYFAENDPPTTRLTLSRPLAAVDFKSAQAVLAEAGYDLSREEYRGKQVCWIQRLIVPPRKPGALVRTPAGGAGEAPARGDGGERPAEGEHGGVNLFELRSGTGARFLLTFETGSRAEADDALHLLRSYRPRQGQPRER